MRQKAKGDDKTEFLLYTSSTITRVLRKEFMMSTVPQELSTVQQMSQALQGQMQYFLTTRADELARETAFVQRKSPLTGAVFAQALIFSFLGQPASTYTNLQEYTALQQVLVSAQAIEQRMTRSAAAFLLALLREMAASVLQNPDPVSIELYERFEGIVLQDGTVIGLPDALKDIWKGFGGHSGASGSALQVQVRLNMSTGQISGPWLADGCACERTGESSLQQAPLPAGALRITDVGYHSADLLRQTGKADQPFFLSGMNANWTVRARLQDPAVDLPTFVSSLPTDTFDGWVWVTGQRVPVRLIMCRLSEQEKLRRAARIGQNTSRRVKGSRVVRVGKKKGLPCVYVSKRCKAGKKQRQMCGWSVVMTTVPQERLSAHEARVLFRSRWQIELLWKLWKQIGQVDTWRSSKPERILCEVYAKLIGLLLQHWLIQMGCWKNPHRSMVKASEVVRFLAPCIVLALQATWDLPTLLVLLPVLMKRCSLNSRKKRPNTSHLLVEALHV